MLRGEDHHLSVGSNLLQAPGHPVKYVMHRSSFDLGPYYRNVVDWQFEKTKSLYRKNLLAHFGCVNAIEFSKDGSLLVSGGDDRRVLLWNVDKAIVSKEEPKVMLAEHLSNVFSLDFSCSSSKIISAGNDDQVIVHDVATGSPLDYFVHEQPVYGVSADPVNESIFCSACDDGRILIFDIRESGNDPFCLAKLTSAFHSVMFHPVEPRLVVTANSKEGVASWDVRYPKRVCVKYGVQNSSQCCMSARFNKEGSQILVLRRRLPPILYATEKPGHLYQFNHRGYYNSCTMKSCSFAGQNDQYVLSGSDNFDLHLWKIPTPGSDQWVNKADLVLRGHRSIVNQVRYNYVHNVIASSGVEKLVKLWSPFPMPDEPGGKTPSVVTTESGRRIYTPDDYVSLVMQAGHGHFMSLTYEAGRKTTREDSRMLAFFDALVQRDISGFSDEESDNFPETSYTNTVYTSPETSSSENEDEDSNPPNFRSLLSTESIAATFSRAPRSINHNEESSRNTNETMPDQISRSGDSSSLNIQEEDTLNSNESNPLNARSLSSVEPGHFEDTESSNNQLLHIGLTEQTEDRDMTANMITKLILEKENSRRKLLSKSNSSANGGISIPVNRNESDSDDTSSSDVNSNSTLNCRLASSSRPLTISHEKKNARKLKQRKATTNSYSSKRKEFRKKLLRARKRDTITTPIYDSSRNAVETTTSAETNYDRISELMTRNLPSHSDTSVDSSSSSSSETSSAEECDTSKNQSVMKDSKKKKVNVNSKKARAIISSDSSGSSSETKNDSNESSAEDELVNKPSTSRAITKEIKRKRRPPCKLNEACKAFFKKYIDSESDVRRENEEPAVPCKRAHLENLESPTTTSSIDANNVEHITFKKSSKSKDRNYRKAGVNSTPPDSGIDVSREPDPCCSKSSAVSDTQIESTMENISSNNATSSIRDKVDDPGYDQVDSEGESD